MTQSSLCPFSGHESQAGQWSAKHDFCRAQLGEQYIVKQHKVCCKWAPDAVISRISIDNSPADAS